jgi:Spy/CpxP family protein refolding chaperone
MKKLYVIALALVLVGWAVVAVAAPPDPGSAPPGPCAPHQWVHPQHRCGSFLNLTQEQREKMMQIRKSFWADVHDLKYDIRIKKIEVQKLFTNPKTDDATLLAKEKELNNLKLKLMDRKAEMKVEWRKVLTPAQIEMLDRGHGYHHGHHHHWGHHHGPNHHWGPMGIGLPPEPPAPMKH